MQDAFGLVIENGKLIKYDGTERELVIPDGVERIECVFRNDHYLRKISFPDSVVYGGWSTFEGCKYLYEVKLSKQMRSVTRLMFYGTAIEKIIIPQKIQSIGDQAFAKCRFLKEVVIYSENIEINASAFYDSPNVSIYCKQELCAHFHKLLGVPCFSLDEMNKHDNGKQPEIDYDNSSVVEEYGLDEPIAKAAVFIVQIEKKEFKVRIKPENCIDTVLDIGNTRYYSFDEARDHYVSSEEAMDEYVLEDPNFSSDGFLFVKHRLDDEATELDETALGKRVLFLRSVYRSLCNKDVAEKIASFAPKKKNGTFSVKEFTRIAGAGMVSKDLKIPEIVAKAKDENIIEVFAAKMNYSADELIKLEKCFFNILSSPCDARTDKPDPISKPRNIRMAEYRLNGEALQLSLIEGDVGKEVFKEFPSFSPDGFGFAKGRTASGYDLTVEPIYDSVYSMGSNLSVIFDLKPGFERSWKQMLAVTDYFRSARKTADFDLMVERIRKVRSFLPDKNKIDSVANPSEKAEACIFAVLSSYSVILKNYHKYAQEIADQLPRKKDGTISLSGGLRGVTLVNDAEVANRGVRSSLFGKAEGDNKVVVRFDCHPEWI